MILGSLDFIPIGCFDFLKHFYFLLNSIPYIDYYNNLYNNNFILYGYSCRSLFHTLMELYVNNNENIKICTTPIHHTSFRNIIELFVKKENITILKLNENYNKVLLNDEDLKKKYDLCIITHLFGQDLNIDDLYKLKENNPKCLFIEDRVQGGSFNKIYSDDIFDIALYSTGMDKKPCGLGGGIIILKNIELYYNLLEIIDNYPQENISNRFIFLIKKIPTYLLYNSKIVIYLILKFFEKYEKNLYNFAKYYRKKNPGFQHDNYNFKPSNPLLKSITYSINNVDKIEKLYNDKSEIYINELRENNLLKYIKWYNNKNLGTVYNTIYCNNNSIINYFNNRYIPIIDNPTYKLFNFDYPNKINDIRFNNSLYYIPSIMNLNTKEIKELVSKLKEFDDSI